MRIAQIILDTASQFERKLQRVDAAALSSSHQVVTMDGITPAANEADVAHVYATGEIAAGALTGLKIPYVASAELRRARFALRRTEPPRYVLSPVAPVAPAERLQHVPEAVAEEYFAARSSVSPGEGMVVGFFRGERAGVANAIEQVISRVQRFRDHVRWAGLQQPPSPSDLSGVEVWADPAVDENDYDGFVAEAIAAGKAVVATRTAMNAQRLEKGRTGFLVPCKDPNEFTHAILAALFKPEVARLKIEAARQTAAKFRPGQRLRVLERIYEIVTE